jgi:hypothetical protein
VSVIVGKFSNFIDCDEVLRGGRLAKTEDNIPQTMSLTTNPLRREMHEKKERNTMLIGERAGLQEWLLLRRPFCRAQGVDVRAERAR